MQVCGVPSAAVRDRMCVLDFGSRLQGLSVDFRVSGLGLGAPLERCNRQNQDRFDPKHPRPTEHNMGAGVMYERSAERCTSRVCIIKTLKSRKSVISSPLWTP